MKRVFQLVLLAAGLAWCVPARAQTFVKAAQNETTSNQAVTVTISTAANDFIVFACRQNVNNTATAAITDSAGQTGWSQTASGYKDDGTGDRIAVFFRANSAALTSATCTWSPNPSATVDGIVYEVSGMVSSAGEDSSVNNTQSSGTTATSGSLTTTNANDILFFANCMNGAFSGATAGSGYTIPTNGTSGRCISEYKIVGATQSGVTTTDTWTTSRANANIFAGFKGAAAGGSTKPYNMSQQNVQR